MAQYESFETKKNKIRTTWEQVEDNKGNIDNNLKKITIKLNPAHFNKKLVKITVLNQEVVSDPGDGGGVIICWVSSVIFGGMYHPKTCSVRYYMLNIAPTWLLNIYKKYGEYIAEYIKLRPFYKVLLKPLFEYFAWRGKNGRF